MLFQKNTLQNVTRVEFIRIVSEGYDYVRFGGRYYGWHDHGTAGHRVRKRRRFTTKGIRKQIIRFRPFCFKL